MIVKKPNGNLTVCLDSTDLNKHIIRPVCNMYTLEDIIDKLKDATHFAIFDSTKSFFHVPLDDASEKYNGHAYTNWYLCVYCSCYGSVKCDRHI